MKVKWGHKRYGSNLIKLVFFKKGRQFLHLPTVVHRHEAGEHNEKVAAYTNQDERPHQKPARWDLGLRLLASRTVKKIFCCLSPQSVAFCYSDLSWLMQVGNFSPTWHLRRRRGRLKILHKNLNDEIQEFPDYTELCFKEHTEVLEGWCIGRSYETRCLSLYLALCISSSVINQ